MGLGGASVLLFEYWENFVLHSTKLLGIAFQKRGEMDISCCKEGSFHALFITSSFHWDQLEEVVSLVCAALVLYLGGLNKPRQVQHQLFLVICRQM